jgi:hypothetical protein
MIERSQALDNQSVIGEYLQSVYKTIDGDNYNADAEPHMNAWSLGKEAAYDVLC